MATFDMNNATDRALKMDMYAICLRKSRADLEAEKLGEGETLARHRKILEELAARKGFYIGEIYEELESGDTIAGRPKMQKLIEDCYAGKYKGILVVEVTRLSRGNQGDALVDEKTFRAAQKKFYKDRTRSNLKLKNPLAELVFCKKCGKAMNYQPYPEGRENVCRGF